MGGSFSVTELLNSSASSRYVNSANSFSRDSIPATFHQLQTLSILLQFSVPRDKHNILYVAKFDAPVEALNLVIIEGMDQCDRLGNHNPNLQECTRCF